MGRGVESNGLGKQEFETKVHRWSHASVHGRHYNPFIHIDWDNPDYEIVPDDDRWILGERDNLGGHPWYQNLSREEKVRIGLFRYAHSVKVGSQFEEGLIAGIMYRNMNLPNGVGEEFRYPMHEAGEEVNHIQMFQKFVDQTGVQTKGAPAWFRHVLPFYIPLGGKLPAVLWSMALAGEEPVDHMQKNLRKDAGMHPLIDRIMEIHIAEEARHIQFAHTWLRRYVPKMNRVEKTVFAVALPIMLRTVADLIMRPNKEARESMGIPKKIAKEIWWDSDDGRKFMTEMFPDARKLADELGLRGKLGRTAWRVMGIDAQSA